MEKECAKCGKCCKEITFTIPGLNNKRDLIEYYKKHGCRIIKEMVIVPSRCQHLTEDNLCDIHNNKPFLCKSWHGQKNGFYVPEGCVYE